LNWEVAGYAGAVGGKIVDIEALKRLAIRLVALAEQHTDLPLQRDLRKLANELIDLIEGCDRFDQSETASADRADLPAP
jgi:hypothetical protein